MRRDELTTLADLGALNAFTNERRSALWQVERAVRPAGELFEGTEAFENAAGPVREQPRQVLADKHDHGETAPRPPGRPVPGHPQHTFESDVSSLNESPLPTMNDDERLHADYAGMGLTIGPHPMALKRDELAMQGVLRATDLLRTNNGRRVRVAGMVITRQRPGTAKGFVFLTLEDETGISNIIVRPDVFDRDRLIVVRQPFLLIDGVLQHQEGVVSVRAERVQGITGAASVDAHDFY